MCWLRAYLLILPIMFLHNMESYKNDPWLHTVGLLQDITLRMQLQGVIGGVLLYW